MFNILILEDDNLTAEMFKQLILEIDPKVNVMHCVSENEAYQFAIDNEVNLFIIDVNLMEGGSGYDFAERIRGVGAYEMTFIIFVTSVAEKKQLAFENIHCYEYLIKPVDEEIFKEALAKVMKYKIVKEERKIPLYKNRRAYIFKPIDIAWVEVGFRDVLVHEPDGEACMFPSYKYPLEKLHEMLGNDFIRIQKSILVNKEYIKSVDYTKELLYLDKTEKPLKMGKKYVKNVRTMLD